MVNPTQPADHAVMQARWVAAQERKKARTAAALARLREISRRFTADDAEKLFAFYGRPVPSLSLAEIAVFIGLARRPFVAASAPRPC